MKPRIAAIVLAAGSASRFGRPKQLALFRGEALVLHALRAAAAADSVTLVTGAHAERVAEAVDGLAATIVHNPGFAEGLASSLRCGVNANRDADAIVVLLADQVLVPAAHVRHLFDTWLEGGHDIVATSVDGGNGPPALFAAATFGALLRLKGNAGAKKLVDSGDWRVTSVPLPAAAIDVDTEADLQRAERYSGDTK